MALLVFIAFLVLAVSTLEDLFKYPGVPPVTWGKLTASAFLFISWKLLIT